MSRLKKQTQKPILKVSAPSGSGRRVEVALALGGKKHTVFFESDDLDLQAISEVILPSALLAAMRHASALELEGDVDAFLLSNLPTFQARLAATDALFMPIPIQHGGARPVAAQRPGRVGLFFSGGTDSWFSLLDHMDEITDLVFLAGADILLENERHIHKSNALARRVADHYGKHLVTVRTNLRAFSDPYVSWHILLDSLMQGPAHLLSGEIGKIYLSSAHTAANLVKYGLDATLPELWSSSRLQVVHDSLTVNRIEKTQRVAQEAFALHNLRVCWKNPKEGLNCGVCEKCIRTMVNLEAVGGLQDCTVFNQPLDLGRVSKLFIKGDSELFNAELNLAAITALQGDSPLARAIATSINNSARRRRIQRWFGVFGRFAARVRHSLKQAGKALWRKLR